MSLISIFVDAFKKALGRKRADDVELARSSGGSLGPSADTDAFDPLRPAPSPTPSRGSVPGGISVTSGDPEEGGERPTVRPPG